MDIRPAFASLALSQLRQPAIQRGSPRTARDPSARWEAAQAVRRWRRGSPRSVQLKHAPAEEEPQPPAACQAPHKPLLGAPGYFLAAAPSRRRPLVDPPPRPDRVPPPRQARPGWRSLSAQDGPPPRIGRFSRVLPRQPLALPTSPPRSSAGCAPTKLSIPPQLPRPKARSLPQSAEPGQLHGAWSAPGGQTEPAGTPLPFQFATRPAPWPLFPVPLRADRARGPRAHRRPAVPRWRPGSPPRPP